MRALALALLAAGCFNPKYHDGNLRCNAGKCPSGYHCAMNDTCWKNGSDPVLDLSVAMEPDGGGVDGGDDGGPAALRHQGESCRTIDTCDTGHCVDGYCCNSTCNNTCQACDVAGSLGLCTNVLAGAAPSGNRSCNAEDKSTCGRDGTCDGAGNCRDWPSGTECKAGTCDSSTGNFTYPSTCSGSGTCVDNGGDNCAPYKCQDATQCFSSCSDSSNCSGSNNCVMQSCGKLPNGRTCAGGNGALCSSGNCVDGHCCDTGCGSACQACDVGGSFGTCTTIPKGAPHGTRACNGSGQCLGSCDGSTADCSYPDNTTGCGVACVPGAPSTQLLNKVCDSKGNCVGTTAATCGGNYKCSGSACVTACSGDGDCAGSAFGCLASSTVCMPFCSLDDSKLDECIWM
jgi:hypothetical protein